MKIKTGNELSCRSRPGCYLDNHMACHHVIRKKNGKWAIYTEGIAETQKNGKNKTLNQNMNFSPDGTREPTITRKKFSGLAIEQMQR